MNADEPQMDADFMWGVGRAWPGLAPHAVPDARRRLGMACPSSSWGPRRQPCRRRSLCTRPVYHDRAQDRLAPTRERGEDEELRGIHSVGPGDDSVCSIVPGIPGAHTQAESLDELQRNLKEVLGLCLEENRGMKQCV